MATLAIDKALVNKDVLAEVVLVKLVCWVSTLVVIRSKGKAYVEAGRPMLPHVHQYHIYCCQCTKL